MGVSTYLLLLVVIFFQLKQSVLAQSGSCSSSVPCQSGCCSKSGYCGFGPSFCGNGNCTSSCNAQAQCGQYAPAGQSACPLNVCCSKYGFCGTTSDFCGTGCQNGCNAPKEPSCSTASGKVQTFRIGYFESWSFTRACDAWTPEMIDPFAYTHLYYAFALVSPSFGVGLMNDFDTTNYQKIINLKMKNPALKVFISIGGWSAGGQIFSQMVSTSTNRAKFISAAIAFMNTYLFDGIDIDWEYPVAPERGGVPADKANFVQFLKELRAACGNEFQISATIPSSYWYMQNFDIVNMESTYIDWFMLLSYDIHGTWDGNNPYTQAIVQPHTNLTEINASLDLLWRNNIDPNKVVMGLAMYGRSFTLKDPSCKTPGCPFSSGGTPGQCTQTSGVLSNSEIQNVISAYSLTPILNTAAAIKYITWNNNQWVSYDDAQTYAMKKDYANGKCLKGYMVWALDLDDGTTQASTSNLQSNGFSAYQQKNAVSKLTASNNVVNLGLYWTLCRTSEKSDSTCAPGWKNIFNGFGKIFDADLGHVTGDACGPDGTGFYFRELCAPSGSEVLAGCQWGAMGKLCDATCPKGSILITKNSWPDTARVSCKAGSYVPLCCDVALEFANFGAFCEFSALAHYMGGSFGMGADVASFLGSLKAGTGQFARGIGPRLSGRSNVRNTSLSKRWDDFGKIGGGYDCFGVGSLPVGAIPVEIPGEMSLIDGVLATLIPATAVAPTATGAPRPTITTQFHYSTTTYSTTARTCDFNNYPQACANYMSVAQYSTFARPTCSRYGVALPARPLTVAWDFAHNAAWSSTWIVKQYVNPYGNRQAVACQRDEWPPALFQQGRSSGYVRLLPGGQNGGVANSNLGGWRGFCRFPAPSNYATYPGGYQHYGNFIITTELITTTVAINVMDYQFTNVPASGGNPYLISSNPCYPATLTADPLYAMLDYDPSNIGRIVGWPYYNTPPASLTNGKTPPTRRRRKVKRGSDGILEISTHETIFQDQWGDYVVVDQARNSTRLATDEELFEHLNLARCGDLECTSEKKDYAEHLKLLRKEASTPAATAAGPRVTSPDEHLHAHLAAGAGVKVSQPTPPPVTAAPVIV